MNEWLQLLLILKHANSLQIMNKFQVQQAYLLKYKCLFKFPIRRNKFYNNPNVQAQPKTTENIKIPVYKSGGQKHEVASFVYLACQLTSKMATWRISLRTTQLTWGKGGDWGRPGDGGQLKGDHTHIQTHHLHGDTALAHRHKHKNIAEQ